MAVGRGRRGGGGPRGGVGAGGGGDGLAGGGAPQRPPGRRHPPPKRDGRRSTNLSADGIAHRPAMEIKLKGQGDDRHAPGASADLLTDGLAGPAVDAQHILERLTH